MRHIFAAIPVMLAVMIMAGTGANPAEVERAHPVQDALGAVPPRDGRLGAGGEREPFFDDNRHTGVRRQPARGLPDSFAGDGPEGDDMHDERARRRLQRRQQLDQELSEEWDRSLLRAARQRERQE